jgi:hypothetical protein
MDFVNGYKAGVLIDKLEDRGALDEIEADALNKISMWYYLCDVKTGEELLERIQDSPAWDNYLYHTLDFFKEDRKSMTRLAHCQVFRERLWHFHQDYIVPSVEGGAFNSLTGRN